MIKPKNKKKIKVQIINPIQGGGFTSLAHAERYIRRGRAIWENGKLRFITTTVPVVPTRKCRPNLVNGDGFQKPEGLKHTPFVGDYWKMYHGKKPNKPPRGEDRIAELESRVMLVGSVRKHEMIDGKLVGRWAVVHAEVVDAGQPGTNPSAA